MWPYRFDPSRFSPYSAEAGEVEGHDASFLHERVMAAQERWSLLRHSEHARAMMVDYSRSRTLALLFFSDRYPGDDLTSSSAFRLLAGRVCGNTGSPSKSEPAGKLNRAGRFQTPLQRSDDEYSRYLSAYEYLCVQQRGRALSMDVILHTHRLVIGDPLSECRTVAVKVDMSLFVSPSYVRTALEALLLDFNRALAEPERAEPFSLAARVLFDFLTIHPFRDGNGRVGRLLVSYILLSYGLPFPCSLGYGTTVNAKHNLGRCLRRAQREEGEARELSMLILHDVRSCWSDFWNHYRLSVERPRQLRLAVPAAAVADETGLSAEQIAHQAMER